MNYKIFASGNQVERNLKLTSSRQPGFSLSEARPSDGKALAIELSNVLESLAITQNAQATSNRQIKESQALKAKEVPAKIAKELLQGLLSANENENLSSALASTNRVSLLRELNALNPAELEEIDAQLDKISGSSTSQLQSLLRLAQKKQSINPLQAQLDSISSAMDSRLASLTQEAVKSLGMWIGQTQEALKTLTPLAAKPTNAPPGKLPKKPPVPVSAISPEEILASLSSIIKRSDELSQQIPSKKLQQKAIKFQALKAAVDTVDLRRLSNVQLLELADGFQDVLRAAQLANLNPKAWGNLLNEQELANDPRTAELLSGLVAYTQNQEELLSTNSSRQNLVIKEEQNLNANLRGQAAIALQQYQEVVAELVRRKPISGWSNTENNSVPSAEDFSELELEESSRNSESKTNQQFLKAKQALKNQIASATRLNNQQKIKQLALELRELERKQALRQQPIKLAREIIKLETAKQATTNNKTKTPEKKASLQQEIDELSSFPALREQAQLEAALQLVRKTPEANDAKLLETFFSYKLQDLQAPAAVTPKTSTKKTHFAQPPTEEQNNWRQERVSRLAMAKALLGDVAQPELKASLQKASKVSRKSSEEGSTKSPQEFNNLLLSSFLDTRNLYNDQTSDDFSQSRLSDLQREEMAQSLTTLFLMSGVSSNDMKGESGRKFLDLLSQTDSRFDGVTSLRALFDEAFQNKVWAEENNRKSIAQNLPRALEKAISAQVKYDPTAIIDRTINTQSLLISEAYKLSADKFTSSELSQLKESLQAFEAFNKNRMANIEGNETILDQPIFSRLIAELQERFFGQKDKVQKQYTNS